MRSPTRRSISAEKARRAMVRAMSNLAHWKDTGPGPVQVKRGAEFLYVPDIESYVFGTNRVLRAVIRALNEIDVVPDAGEIPAGCDHVVSLAYANGKHRVRCARCMSSQTCSTL